MGFFRLSDSRLDTDKLVWEWPEKQKQRKKSNVPADFRVEALFISI
jgi:hypothetical protein